MRRRVASERRATTPVAAARCAPVTSRRAERVPAGIARPPYAPDAPALVPAVPPDEIPDRMRAAGRAAREVLLEVGAAVAVGVTTDELDRICHEAYIARGGYPSTLDYKGYPKSLCTSVNEVICHGIPDDRALATATSSTATSRSTCTACTATAARRSSSATSTTSAGGSCRSRTNAMWKGIDAVRPGARIYEIGRAIQKHAEAERVQRRALVRRPRRRRDVPHRAVGPALLRPARRHA